MQTRDRPLEARTVSEQAAVEIRNVYKDYDGVTAVDGVSMSIANGEFFALLGPSGCGKTTTLKMIAGFEQPSAGDLLISGRSVRGIPPFKRNVNLVFQDYALFPHLDVRDNVAFGLRMKGLGRRERRARAVAAIERVHLKGYERRRTAELSGGQQQRVALARALVNEPAVLLLDEPLGALDLKLRRAMQLELKAIQRDVGISFIYVTHDQEEALSMADRVAVMNHGRALQIGSPREIYHEPATRFVAGFIGNSSFLSGRITQQGAFATLITADGTSIRARAGDGDLADATLMVRPEAVKLAATAPSPDPHVNAVEATIEQDDYTGGSTYYHLRTTWGDPLIAQMPDTVRFSPGERVFAAFRADEARILLNDDPGGSDLEGVVDLSITQPVKEV
jgi:spermidine/putrescine transport system ATP-binding protein